MNITLPRVQQEWLEALVAKGEFASVEDAVQRMIADRMAFDADDMAWAEPLVADGRSAAARGEVFTLEDHEARMDELLRTLKR